jgi:hypothetical protein
LSALTGRPLLVLGMHRSGTSSFAGLAARLGARLGEDLLEANEFNPRGYGEHRGVVAIHDRFLAAQGLAWNAPRGPERFDGEAAAAARDALRALLLGEFADAPLFALKDPRLCRLLPLWRPLLEDLGARPACVLVLRHPLEIAASLERRDALPRSRSLLLYLEHVLAAERDTRGLPRSFVRYDELFADWRGVAKRVASECALRWPRDPEAAAPEVEAFLSGDLRHHRTETWPEAEAARFPWAAAAHAELLELARRGPGADRSETLDGIGRELAAAAALYGPELAERDARAARLEAERREAEQAARKAERQRERLIASPRLWVRSFLGRALRRGAGPDA